MNASSTFTLFRLADVSELFLRFGPPTLIHSHFSKTRWITTRRLSP